MTSNWSQRRRGLLIDGLLAVSVLVLGLILLQPGVFSVDESHYLLAADAFAREGSFHIDNGYEQYRADELLFFYTLIPDAVERLGTVATVPPYHAVLAAPYLKTFGLTGLFLLNLICFAATCIAVRRLASRLHSEGHFATVAASVFMLGSFGLEYALGIWPHALSQTLIAWALEAFLCARESKGRRALFLAGLSGLLASVATGVRIQNIFMLPVLLVMARWSLGCSWPLLASHLAGWVPPLIGYSLINLHRLDTPNPFTYGARTSLAGSVPGQFYGFLADHPWVLLVIAAGCAGLWFLWRKFRWRGLLPGLLLSAAVTLVVSPELRSLAGHWLSMAGFHLVDTAFVPADGMAATGSTSNQLGQVLYGGVLKKGLLEVAPFLVLALLVVLGRPLQPETSRVLKFLGGSALLSLVLLPLVASSGGFCFNPRYLLEMLPALVVASLYFGLHLLTSRAVLLGGILLGVILALPTVINPGSVDAPADGCLPMLAPLLLALGLLVSASIVIFCKDRWRGAVRQIACGLLGAALAYGIFIQLGVDLGRSNTVRYYAKRILEEGEQVIPGNSVLLAWEARKDVLSPLKLERDVLIAGIGPADREVPGFIRSVIAGRRVFFLQDGIPPDRWAEWSAPYRLREQERSGLVFVELTPGETHR